VFLCAVDRCVKLKTRSVDRANEDLTSHAVL